MKGKIKLTIGWLYPDLMSTYGDRGNIFSLKKRCEWRGIDVHILRIDQQTPVEELANVDFLFGGGAQDREQEIVMRDLIKKQKVVRDMIERGIPALFVCGSPQIMGRYYEPAEGKRIEGLGIFDIVTIHPGNHKPRLIGNTVADPLGEFVGEYIVGFENHGGRTYLGKSASPFAKVVRGFGNNGEDGTEGVVYKNAVGCYFHGPFLPKNPKIADIFIQKALQKKYKKEIELTPIDDLLEQKAREVILSRLQ